MSPTWTTPEPSAEPPSGVRHTDDVSVALATPTTTPPPPEKKWEDIDFEAIFPHNPLGRLQWFCSCPSGNNLVSPCAHVAAILLLIVLCVNNQEEEFFKQDERVKKIRDNVFDAKPHMEQIKADFPPKFCRCQAAFREGDFVMECSACGLYIHPECQGELSSKYDGLSDKDVKGWVCKKCQNDKEVKQLWTN